MAFPCSPSSSFMPLPEAPPAPVAVSSVRTESPAPEYAPAYAGFWKRAWAFMVDIGIVYLLLASEVSLLIPAVDMLADSGTISEEFRAPLGEFLGTYLFLLSYWLYHALMESSAGQATLGKRLMRIRVTDMEGRPVSFLRASARNLGKLLSDLTYWIGFFMAGFSPRKQALHDYLAGCVVVNSSPQSPVTGSNNIARCN